MDLFYFKASTGNFGDDLNLWLWDDILPGWREMLPNHLLIGVGTLLNDVLPPGPKLVIGSGVGYGRNLPTKALLSESRIIALRGPASARQLGLPEDMGVVDPAVLISDFPRFNAVSRSGRTIFIPHISSVNNYDWTSICRRAGIDFVSPAGEADDVIRRIAGASLVLAESMHAAILADAFRVPWSAISVSSKFNYFKWSDWAESLKIDLVIHSTKLRGSTMRGTADADPTLGGGGYRENRDPGGASRLRRLNLALQSRIRQPLRQFALPLQLSRLAAKPGQLSQSEVLEARKAELRQRLVELRNAI